jgi:hypothetical protein
VKEANKTLSYWTLTFERGESVTDVNLASMLAGISSLHAGDSKNNWMTLSKYSTDAVLLGFGQTRALADGFIVEIRIENALPRNLGFWKAGRREPPGELVSQSKEGKFKTFTNEVLSIEDANAIFEHFYRQFELHPDFAWRSILDSIS